jgi:hypothetical protein
MIDRLELVKALLIFGLVMFAWYLSFGRDKKGKKKGK